MTDVSISIFPCLGKTDRTEKLNALFNRTNDIMPHQVAIETGCEDSEALKLLLLLYSLGLAQIYLQVYHLTHPDVPILLRPALEGFPTVPFICEECGDEIVDKKELGYTLRFMVIDRINFIYENSVSRRDKG